MSTLTSNPSSFSIRLWCSGKNYMPLSFPPVLLFSIKLFLDTICIPATEPTFFRLPLEAIDDLWVRGPPPPTRGKSLLSLPNSLFPLGGSYSLRRFVLESSKWIDLFNSFSTSWTSKRLLEVMGPGLIGAPRSASRNSGSSTAS